MRQDRLKVPKPLHQRHRRLLANPFHPRDVVSRITHQGHNVDQLCWGDTKSGPHCCGVGPPVTHRVPQPHPWAHQLHQILVARHHHALHLLRRYVGCQRGDDVVRFNSGDGQSVQAKPADDAVNQGDLWY